MAGRRTIVAVASVILAAGSLLALSRLAREAHTRPVIRSGVVSMLGDSLTFHGDWAELLGCEHVNNFGVEGETTAEILARLPDVLASDPLGVFIMGGANDILQGLTPQQTTQNLTMMVRQLIGARVPVFVEALTPVREDYAGTVSAERFNAEASARNSIVSRAVLEAGGAWIDWGSLLEPSDYLDDGIHYSPSGYAKRAAQVDSYLSACRPPGQPTPTTPGARATS
jgi:lysophospholipase L1-like esterase